MKKVFRNILILIIVGVFAIGAYAIYSLHKELGQVKDNRPNFSKNKQFTRPDLMGEIKTISQDEIVLKVIKFSLPGKDDSKTYDAKKSSVKKTFQIEYTGEEKVIKISSDLKILKSSRSSDGVKQDELNISELKTGDILSITYKEDKTTIDKILLDVRINNSQISSN